jgi:hypothetical protein
MVPDLSLSLVGAGASAHSVPGAGGVIACPAVVLGNVTARENTRVMDTIAAVGESEDGRVTDRQADGYQLQVPGVAATDLRNWLAIPGPGW